MEVGEIGKFVINKGKELGAKDVALKLKIRTVKQIRFSNNQVDIIKTWKKQKGQVFSSVGKKLGFSEFTSFDQTSILRSVEMAISSARNSEENPDFVGIYPGPFEEVKSERYGEPEMLDDEKNIDAVNGAINAALENGAKKVAGTLYAYETYEAIFTSEGAEYVLPPSYYAVLSVRAFVDPELSGHVSAPSIERKGLDYEWAGIEAAKIATMSNKKIKIDPGKYDVAFTQMGISEILEVISSGFSGYYIYIGMSPLSGMLGKEVASEIFTLAETPRKEGTIRRALVDEEGHVTKNKNLIEKGVMKNMLLNYWLSEHFKLEDTGNAGIYAPRAFTIFVSPGDYTLEEMISEMKRGLVITNTWYLRFQNYRTGTFSVVPRDNTFYVENGEVAGVARNLRVSDEALRLLKNVVGVGKEVRQVYWWELSCPVFTPPILIKEVNITRAVK